MKTNLTFYLNDKAETCITTIYDYQTAPIFKKGYRFWFSVSDLYPKTISELSKEYKTTFVDSIIADNKEKIKNFNNTEFKIVSIYSEMKFDQNLSENHRMVIEYRCKKIKHFYWRFWDRYKFKQFFNLKNYFN